MVRVCVCLYVCLNIPEFLLSQWTLFIDEDHDIPVRDVPIHVHVLWPISIFRFLVLVPQVTFHFGRDFNRLA